MSPRSELSAFEEGEIRRVMAPYLDAIHEARFNVLQAFENRPLEGETNVIQFTMLFLWNIVRHDNWTAEEFSAVARECAEQHIRSIAN